MSDTPAGPFDPFSFLPPFTKEKEKDQEKDQKDQAEPFKRKGPRKGSG